MTGAERDAVRRVLVMLASEAEADEIMATRDFDADSTALYRLRWDPERFVASLRELVAHNRTPRGPRAPGDYDVTAHVFTWRNRPERVSFPRALSFERTLDNLGATRVEAMEVLRRAWTAAPEIAALMDADCDGEALAKAARWLAEVRLEAGVTAEGSRVESFEAGWW